MSRGTAVVTGGGGAIAREIAQRLEAAGYDLVLVDMDAGRMAATAATLRREPVTVTADLSDAEQIAATAALIEDAHRDLTLLVNNAGFIEPGDVDVLSPELLDRHIAVNLLAPMHLSRVAARVMRPRGSGDILSIVSNGGILARPGSAPYAGVQFWARG